MMINAARGKEGGWGMAGTTNRKSEYQLRPRTVARRGRGRGKKQLVEKSVEELNKIMLRPCKHSNSKNC